MTDNVPEETKKKMVIETGETGSDCPIRFVYKDKKLEKIIIEKESQGGLGPLKRVIGTGEIELFVEIINKSVGAMGGSNNGHRENAIVQSLADCKPNNAMEARLCAQAQVLFIQGMQLISYANDETMMLQQEHCLKNAIKFLRLHNETVLALEKLRRGGEQKMTIQHQHFHVNDGGQAAIMAGNFQTGGGEKEKIED